MPTTLLRNLLKEQGEPRFEDVTAYAGLMRAGKALDAKIGGIGDTAGGVGCADAMTVTATRPVLEEHRRQGRERPVPQ
ncbi:MAG: hypothetical protein U1F18_06100 [Steroidobacteraceae bacterium]